MEEIIRPLLPPEEPVREESLEAVIERRVRELTAYQSPALAERYRRLVERVREAEARIAPASEALAGAVARSYAKLLAYKDEYEVARLYSDGRFRASLERQFDGEYRLSVHLAPPLIASRDPETGALRKREYGPWVLRAMGLLARLRRLRGTPLDPFGYTEERRMERALIGEYERTVERLLAGLDGERLPLAVEIASLPEEMRGFGHVKLAAVTRTRAREAELLARYEGREKVGGEAGAGMTAEAAD